MTVNEIKQITALHVDKFRKERRAFLVEGPKMVAETLRSNFKVKAIYALPDWKTDDDLADIPVVEISAKELSRISQLKTPNQVVAEVEMKRFDNHLPNAEKELIVALDNINNPGNLGTIIRTADWFGFRHIVCSQNCADLYNSKVLQATMGSFTRVNVYYTDLPQCLQENYKKTEVYGAVVDGESLYDVDLQEKGVIVIGNESQGISAEILPFVRRRITIPSYGGGAESLNASIAAAVILGEFRRRK